MNTTLLTTRQPFSLAQSLKFICRFAAVKDDYAITDQSITAAVTLDGAGHWFTLRGDTTVTIESSGHAALPKIAADFIGATDDLRGFYACAAEDAPFRPLVKALYGLHHVRFLTLEEIAVYCVMMQRNPITRAAALKKKFLAAFGRAVNAGGRTLRAMPEMAELVDLTGDEIGRAISHGPKGAQIEGVVKGVASIGRTFLETAPYDQARDALLKIKGVGPFSAGAILLRGLGRMDELPSEAIVADEARAVYGKKYDYASTIDRYGAQVGYWSYYLKTGVARGCAN